MTAKLTPNSSNHIYYIWTENHGVGMTSSDPQPYGTTRNWLDQIESSTKMPNYRRVIAEGGCATTPLSVIANKVTIEPTHCDCHVTNETLGYDFNRKLKGNFHDEGLAPGDFTVATNATINRSLVKFYQHLNSVQTAFKGQVFGGELKESLAMVRHPARSLRKAVSTYLSYLKSRGGRLRPKDRPSFVRDTWLEYSFGWKPLINDIDDAMSAIASSGVAKPVFEMVRGKAMDVVERGRRNVVYNPVQYVLIYGTVVTRELVQCKHYGTYRNVAAREAPLHHYGFSVSEFVPTMWELIPYSFLVDYFTNIGGILEALSYRNLGAAFVSRTVVQQNSIEMLDKQFVMQTPPPGYKVTHTGQTGGYLAQYYRIIRTPNEGTPIPDLILKVPGKWTQWANIVALSKQLDSARVVLNRP